MAVAGHEAVVEALIEHGADVNMLDKNGRGPLHIATQLNDIETVQILLDHRADPGEKCAIKLVRMCEHTYLFINIFNSYVFTFLPSCLVILCTFCIFKLRFMHRS